MNKKLVIGISIIILIIVLGIIGYAIINNNQIENNNNNSSVNEVKKDEEKADVLNEHKILVVYYSAQSHTKAVAKTIADNLNADTFEIVPEDIYTSDDLNWSDNNSRVSREHDDESLRNIKLKNTKVNNWENYDTILIGYPIWWGIAAWPVNTFVKENNFDGKTVIPFCTSSSSGIGQSGKLLEQEANSGKWLEGHRFNSNPSNTDIKNWIDSIK